jgi:REP element-mobilizing transposase RayT
MTKEKPGWHSRGYLPHFDIPNLVQFITFRLADALPKSALDQIEMDIRGLPLEKQEAVKRQRLEKWMDRGHGACWLALPQIAGLVENHLLAEDGDAYMLLGWTLMPNHVHIVAEFADDALVGKVVKAWKGAAAVLANETLERSGRFWFSDYWDRYIRDTAHLRNVIRYIDQNPVKAGLCDRPGDWQFGSARLFSDPCDSPHNGLASSPNEFGGPR